MNGLFLFDFLGLFHEIGNNIDNKKYNYCNII